MGRRGRERILILFVALALCPAAGCWGISQNPSYFPYYSFTGDIVQTHAKPVGKAYYANFDPHAVKIEVRPLEATNPVRKKQVLIATVVDEKGLPRRDRRVEWILEGVGNIEEVDEYGYWAGRGYKVDNKYGVSYTEYKEHHVTRGNADPSDDFVIRPGQSWCVISSPVEGDTVVTAYAPEIYNWDNQRAFVTQHWVDAEWTIPVPAVNRAGTEHVLNTIITRHTDKQPLANYRVRYTIVDGPPAVFLPDRSRVHTSISDLGGSARAVMVQELPQPGQNRIAIEIIRPPDPTSPSGVGIVVGRGETTKQWQAPQATVAFTGPATAALGQELNYNLTITNTGTVEIQALTVRDPLPQGLELVQANPRPIQEGNQLTWTLGLLPLGQSHTIQQTLRVTRPGHVENCVQVTSFEGIREDRCVPTEVSNVPGINPAIPPLVPQPQPGAPIPGGNAPPLPGGNVPPIPGEVPPVPQPGTPARLTLNIDNPPSAGIGVPVTYQITVTNIGGSPATNVRLTAEFDKRLEHESRHNKVEMPLQSIASGKSITAPLILTPRAGGQLAIRVTLEADGKVQDRTERTLDVQQAQLSVKITGQKSAYVEQTVAWEIRVVNPTDLPLSNVTVRAQLPPEITFLNASDLGGIINGQVVWNIGSMAARDQRALQLSGRAQRLAQRVITTVTVSADPGVQESAEAPPLDIMGVPAFAIDVKKQGDPVIKGGKVTYTVVVTNTGSLPANGVSLNATVTSQLQITSGSGPADPRIEPAQITFPAMRDGLQPGAKFTYTIEALGLQAGDARFRANVSTATLLNPVFKEESTTIIDPANGQPRPPGPPR